MVVGLGNPGSKYERNRHNAGFRVVDHLARRHGMQLKGSKLGGDLATGMITTPRGREKAVLLEPMEFMNLSGFAVQRAAKFHDVAVDQIVVAHDEIDLDPGVLRVKRGGGHGGHNGLRSIIEQLASPEFLRVRIGVGKGPSRSGDAATWVLSDFADEAEADALCSKAADAVEVILGLGVTAAMNQFNGKGESSGASAPGAQPKKPS
jgi:PTH1 family peptidyl-tRNA hydrolase